MSDLFRRRFAVLAAAAVACLALTLATDASAASGPTAKNGGAVSKVEGTATRINASTGLVVVRLQGGTIRRLNVPSSAKVERNDVRAPLSSFKVGDFVQAKFNANGVIFKIEAVGP